MSNHTPDRVNIGLKRTISTAPYESFVIEVNMGTDRNEGEQPQQTMDRVLKEVGPRFDKLVNLLKQKYSLTNGGAKHVTRK